MDRADATGFGVLVLGHLLLAYAGVMVATGTSVRVAEPSAFEVSYVDEVGLTAASPNPAPTAQASVAPEVAPPEEAAPAPAATPEPSPAPPSPAPRPTPAPRATPAPPRQAAPAPTRQQATGTRQRNAASLLGPNLLRGIGNDRNAASNSPPAQMTGQAMANIGQAIQRQI